MTIPTHQPCDRGGRDDNLFVGRVKKPSHARIELQALSNIICRPCEANKKKRNKINSAGQNTNHHIHPPRPSCDSPHLEAFLQPACLPAGRPPTPTDPRCHTPRWPSCNTCHGVVTSTPDTAVTHVVSHCSTKHFASRKKTKQ